MSSIDEDGLGDELEVIWEIEAGAQVIERAGLLSITGQDDSDTLEAFLDAVRWDAATNADRGFLQADRKRVVSGKGVSERGDLGGRHRIKEKSIYHKTCRKTNSH